MFCLKGSANVSIKGVNDKRQVTATFTVSPAGFFLPIQLIYNVRPKDLYQNTNFQRNFTLLTQRAEILQFISKVHCVKTVQIRSYFWSVFSLFGLNTDQKKLSIWTLFTQWSYFHIYRRKKKQNLDIRKINFHLLLWTPSRVKKTRD